MLPPLGRAVAAGPAYQIAQILKLLTQSLQIVLGKEGLDMGLDLTHNTAHILPAHEGAAVLAVFNEAAVPAGNAAQIIADVRITDGAGIAGGGNGAAGIAGRYRRCRWRHRTHADPPSGPDPG